MKILMLSLDKTLLGASGGGDAQERHRRYGDYVEKLDMVIFSGRGFAVNRLSERVTAFPTNSFSRWSYIFDAYRVGKELFRKNNYDLIDTQDPFFTGLVGYWLKKKFKKPLEAHFHGDFWDNPYLVEDKVGRVSLLLSGFLTKRVDGVRAVSSGIKEKLVRRGIPAEKIEVIPTPVDAGKFAHSDPEKVREIRDAYLGKKIILYVGRFARVKNLPLLLKAIALVRNTKHDVALLLIGEGGEKRALQKMVRFLKLEDAVTFMSPVAHQKLVNYYHAADVFVLPSWSESLGKVLIEAGASGCPVVSTATTGARDIVVDGQTGFLVPISDENVLTEKILRVLRMDESERKHMGENARRFVTEKFNQEKSIRKIVEFWKKIIKCDANIRMHANNTNKY